MPPPACTGQPLCKLLPPPSAERRPQNLCGVIKGPLVAGGTEVVCGAGAGAAFTPAPKLGRWLYIEVASSVEGGKPQLALQDVTVFVKRAWAGRGLGMGLGRTRASACMLRQRSLHRHAA